MNERVCIFIDGSNLDRSVVGSFGKRVQVESLAAKLATGRRLMKVLYYEAPLLPEVDKASFEAQQRFFQRLRSDPHFDIRCGRRVERDEEFKCPHCGKTSVKKRYEQKGVDALIVFDIVSLGTRDAYDVALLVAGDQDFILPVLEVRMLGKVVENAFTDYGWAPTLRMIADRTILLDNAYLQNCWQK